MKAPEFDVEFGKRVRAARQAAHLTQDQLARRLGLSRPSVVNIEAGRQGVYLRFLVPLAEALGCPAASLLPFDDGADRPHPRYDQDDLEFLSLIKKKVGG
jgi:transcriptional regulator with XRE-family HTH domain